MVTVVAAEASLLAVDAAASVIVVAVAVPVAVVAVVSATVEVVEAAAVLLVAVLAAVDVVVLAAAPVAERKFIPKSTSIHATNKSIVRLLSSPIATLVSSLPVERRISLLPRT